MDRRFDPDPGKRTANFTPADELSREFLLPVGAGYGILEQAPQVVKNQHFTTFLLLLAAAICRDLPRFAAYEFDP